MERCQAEAYCKGFSEKCNEYCIGYNQLRVIYSLSRIPKRYQFDMKLIGGQDRKAFEELQDFRLNVVEHVKNGDSLFLHSQNKGNGKTSWSCKIMNEYFRHVALDNNLRCRGLFVNTPKFLDDLRKAMNDDEVREEMQEFTENILTADIVIWDDIGTETPSRWVRQTLYNYINHRYNEMKTQICTSNMSLSELAREDWLGERITDRIRSFRVIEFVEESRRGESD